MASKRSKMNVEPMKAVETSPTDVHAAPRAFDHERSDVNIRGIVWFTLVFAAAVVAVHFALVAYLGDARTPTIEHQSESVAQKETFRGPVFQANPHDDLRRFEVQQKQQLTEYRWVDAKQRVAAVPIEEAIGVLASQGINQAEAKRQAAVEAHDAAGDKSQPAKSDGDVPRPSRAPNEQPAEKSATGEQR